MRSLISLSTILLLATVPLITTAGESAGYDPTADPFADLKAAEQVASEQGKHILVKVGGDWCSWCRLMEAFIRQNRDVQSTLEAAYVVVKVSYTEDNPNEDFLSRYPEVSGYPHLFVLDAQGKLLHSQSTGELESGRGYSKDAFLKFLRTWAPAGAATGAKR